LNAIPFKINTDEDAFSITVLGNLLALSVALWHLTIPLVLVN